jgi:probable rRNA maturation factor
VVEVEVIGAHALGERAPARAHLERLCALAAASAGVEEGHVAIEFVDAERSARLNERHRGVSGPTDVLSFPVDGAGPVGAAARELGDVVVCPEHTADVCEAVLHGALHLVGMDHERDDGEMLAVQAELLRWERLPSAATAPAATSTGATSAKAAPPEGALPEAAPPEA